MDALSRDEETLKRGLPLDALRPVLPSNRSNRRRVVESLIHRGDLEWVDDEETGERRLRLAWWSSLWAWRASRLPKSLEYERLTRESRLLVIHSRAYVENARDYYLHEETEIVRPCFRGNPEHDFDASHLSGELCSRLWWQDVESGPLDERAGYRRIPCGRLYTCHATPEGVKPDYSVGIFGAFPVKQIEVIRGDDGEHEETAEKVKASHIPMFFADE